MITTSKGQIAKMKIINELSNCVVEAAAPGNVDLCAACADVLLPRHPSGAAETVLRNMGTWQVGQKTF